MPLLDRFTRDEVSAKIWWPLALLLVVAFVLTFPGRGRAIEDVQAHATDWSVSVTTDFIAPVLAASDVADGSIDEESSLTAALDGASAGGALRAIRIWGSDGTLLFSTLSSEQLGSQEALNDNQVAAALEAQGPVTLTVEESPSAEDIAPQFHVYLAVPDVPGLVAQFEFPESRFLEDVRSNWFVYQLIAGIAAIVALIFAALSTREPIARIGAKVPFYPTSIPKGSAVMDLDEAAALKQSGYHARQRVAAMEGRLHELEEENRKLGGDLQRALTALSTTQRQGVPTAIPRAVAQAAAAPPAAASVAPADELAPAGSDDTVQIARPPREAKPGRKRRPAPKLEPVSQPEPEPEPTAAISEPVTEPEPVVEPKPVTEREPVVEREPVTEREPVVEPEPVVEAEPLVVVLPEPEPEVAPEPEPSAEPVPSVAASDDDRGPVYEETWGSSVREPEPIDDLLARIAVPEAAPVSAEEASILRAKLARTAALKKPGSRERREATEHGKH